MKKTLTIQKGGVSSVHAEFDSAFTHFIDHGSSGLMLVAVPTGVGKTTQAESFIFNHYKEKTFFYVTPLNKNVNEAYEKTKKLFSDYGLSDEFDRRAIILQSNMDMFEQHVDSVKHRLDDSITSLKTFKKLIKKLPFNKLDDDDKNEVSTLESQFRRDLYHLITEKFQTKIPSELISKIESSETFSALIDLYPSIKSSGKNIFFLSVDKLYVGNTPIVETHYDFIKKMKAEETIVFLDEFDSVKEKLLGKMISEAIDGEIDLPQLFRHINDRIRNNGRSVNKQMLNDDLPGKDFNRTSRYAFERTVSVFAEKVDKYNADSKFKYVGSANSEYFILSDWSTPIVIELGKTNTPNLYVTYNEEYHCNDVSDKRGDIKLTSVFKPISGAIDFFVNAVKLISSNKFDFEKNKKTGEVITLYDCINSVLGNFDFTQNEKYWNYISPLINNKIRNKNDEIRKDKFDVDFYTSGFDYISISNRANDDYSSLINCISLHNTPENYLVQLAQKAHVIGMSATALFETVTGNFDLNYVKSKIGELFYIAPEADKASMDKHIEERLSNNSSVPNVIELHISDNDTFGLDRLFDDYYDAKHYALTLKKEEAKESDDKDTIDNNCERFSKLLQAIVHFIDNEESRVLLAITNRNIGKGIHNLDKYKELCILFKKNIDNVEFISLSSKTWDEDVKKYENSVRDHKKIILFTSYQSASTGQNLQYIEKIDQFEHEKDIDALYLEYPTHQIVKNEKELTKEQKIEAIYQVDALYEYGMLSSKQRNLLIKSYLSGCYSDVQNSMYKCRSTKAHVLKVLCQAIGRVSRTEGKKGNAYIYIDEEIAKKVDSTILRGGVYTKEFTAFLDYIHSAKQESLLISDENCERLNIAQCKSKHAKEMFDNFLLDWGHYTQEEMIAWNDLRSFAILNPTIRTEKLKDDPQYEKYYMQAPAGEQINNYFYSGSNDNVDDISYSETNDVFYPVNDNNVCLEYLNNNAILSKVFNEKGIPTKWEASDYILIPNVYRNIYKGAIGELCVKTLLEQYNIKLDEITDPNRFEKFDYVIHGKSNIGVDAKFWSISSAIATIDDFTNQVQVEKVIKKMNESNFEKCIIVNILCKNASKTITKPHLKGEGRMLIIPSLINPDSDEASIDKDAINAIIDFVEEDENGK